MENVRNHVDVRLLTKWNGRYQTEAMIAKPNFHSRSVFSENLVAVEMRKLEVKFNKPIYRYGPCILAEYIDNGENVVVTFVETHVRSHLDQICLPQVIISVNYDALSEHIKADSEVQQYRRCLKHYNQPWQRTHVDGPAPFDISFAVREHLKGRLARGDQGINSLDEACREHDIAYSHSNDLAKRHVADEILTTKARKRITAKDSTFGEKAAVTTVWAAMKAKTKLGMGLKTKTKTKKKKSAMSKRILPVAKRGGTLPILPILGVLGSMIGGAAGVAKAVNDNKVMQRQLKELKRHNRVIGGHGLYLLPRGYKRGQGISTRKKKVKKILEVPKGVWRLET
ncbi:PREDICTED: uncharacterized protein LOC105449806 [Wasmannia auropunctata]|uniref:uncharacterized protein LOC105449806 n=1 Tax=Wasmannia auropunctata TaxID=64793 RepID=UPI0005EEB411|nr:PREDICTED: uncharacterized protein LOC105449806 [Wasmannia auropunctata]